MRLLNNEHSRRVFAYLKRHQWMGTAPLAYANLGILMVAVFPAMTKRIIDEVLIQHRAERLTPQVLIAAWPFSCRMG